MFTDFADLAVWVIRLAVAGGLAWGGWLCFSHAFLPARSARTMELEHFATYALLILVLTTLGGLLHAA